MLIDDVINKRMEICKACPLYKDTDKGAVCDGSKYISPDGKEWSYFKKDNWKKGCNCNLERKTKNLNNHCIINLW